MSCEEVKQTLRDAMAHVKLALDMCFRQYRTERIFVLEHPTSASSWATAMMRQMVGLEGVYTAKL